MDLKIQKMQFKTKIADLFPEQYKALQEARKSVEIIENNILELYNSSPRRQAAYDLASENRGGGNPKAGMTSAIVGHQIISETSIDVEKTPVAAAMFEMSTVNLLLNGPLLKDKEKRKLLKKINLDDILDTPAPVDPS